MVSDAQLQHNDSISVPIVNSFGGDNKWMTELHTAVQDGSFKVAFNYKPSDYNLPEKDHDLKIEIQPAAEIDIQEKYRDVESNDLNRLALTLRTNPKTFVEAAEAYQELIRRADSDMPQEKIQLMTERLNKIQIALMKNVDIKGKDGIFEVDESKPLTEDRKWFFQRLIIEGLQIVDDKISYRMKLTDLYAKFAPDRVPLLKSETKGLLDAIVQPRTVKGEQKSMLDLIKLESRLLTQLTESDPELEEILKDPSFLVNKGQAAIERIIARSEYSQRVPPPVAPELSPSATPDTSKTRMRPRRVPHRIPPDS